VLAWRVRSHVRGWRRALRELAAAAVDGLRCATEVALVLVATLALAALTWKGTTEHRRVLEAPAQHTSTGRLEGSLVDTTTVNPLEARRADAGRGAPRPAPAEQDATPSEGAGIGGWLLSVVAVTGVLAGGGLAVVLVVRRHRRRPRPVPGPVDDAPACAEPEQPEAVASDEGDDPAAGRADVEDHGAHEEPAVAVTAAVHQQDGGSPAAGTVVAVDPPPSGRAVGAQDGTTRLLSHVAVLEQEPPAPRFATRQRVFERRTAARVEYVRPGVLLWDDSRTEVTVCDLSTSGLRLRSTAPVGQVPRAAEDVQVELPLDDGPLHARARVVWRRTKPDCVELGLTFVDLVYEDAERISALCHRRR
jgi:hypothetical protein